MENKVRDIFITSGALKEGHFLLTSGLHSKQYVQCALVLQYPDYTEELCKMLAKQMADMQIDVVVGPAMGGVTLAYEMGRQLKVRALFAERENGNMALRRGFNIKPGEKVLVVEDVVTTGGSVKEVIELLSQQGGQVVAVGSLVDRSAGKADFGVPFYSLYKLEIPTFKPEECPMCMDGDKAYKPGSRNRA